jgi:thiol-disulfide isomerase/thioredoxin
MALRLRTEIPTFDGIAEWINGEINTDDLAGKPVLVHFWSISCGLCKLSLPDLNELRQTYPSLQMIGIHMPRSEKDMEITKVKETIEQYALQHPQGIDNTYAVVDRFENQFVPAYYLFDGDGQLRHRSAGEKALSMLKSPLARVVDEALERES